MRRAGPYVLVIDDDKDFLAIVRALLEDKGYCVRCFSSPRRALRGLESDPPSLVVLDLRMPGMTGWEFLEIKQRRPRTAKVPVVVTSAYLDDQPFTAGAACFAIPKPVDLDRLLSVVATFVRPHALASDSESSSPAS